MGKREAEGETRHRIKGPGPGQASCRHCTPASGPCTDSSQALLSWQHTSKTAEDSLDLCFSSTLRLRPRRWSQAHHPRAGAPDSSILIYKTKRITIKGIFFLFSLPFTT